MGERLSAPLHTTHAPESFHAIRWEGVWGEGGRGRHPAWVTDKSLFPQVVRFPLRKSPAVHRKEGYVSDGKERFFPHLRLSSH